MNASTTILHHVETGPPDGPPVVLLHGFLGSSADWQQVVAPLAEDFRCIAIDLPGHGASTRLADEAYTWEGALDALEATLAALTIDRFRLAGYSMGGRLALGLALRRPGRARRLALVGASPGIESAADRASRAGLDEDRAAELERDPDAFVRAWYRMPLFASLARRNGLLDGLIASRAGNDPAEAARALRGFSTGRMPSYWGKLDGLGAPTMAIAGARDPKFVDLAFRMAAAGRPVMPLVLPRTGHLVPLEHPALLADSLHDFFGDALLVRQPGPTVTAEP
jgi:2-succinyl-6-hydroxy-2,4-cyclohexadiene-1-carboxylate synthase